MTKTITKSFKLKWENIKLKLIQSINTIYLILKKLAIINI